MMRRIFANSDAQSQERGGRHPGRATAGRAQLQFVDRPARHGRDRAGEAASCATSRPASPGWRPSARARLKRDAAGVTISASARFDRRRATLRRLAARRLCARPQPNLDRGQCRRAQALDLRRPVARRGAAARPRYCAVGPPARRGRWRRQHPHRRDRRHRRQRPRDPAGRAAGLSRGQVGECKGDDGRGEPYRQDRADRLRFRRRHRCWSPAPAPRRRKARSSPAAPRCSTFRSIAWATTGRSNSPRAAGQWALANLSNGEIDVAAEFSLSAPDNDLAQLKVDRMVGLIDYRGMTVRYMPHMPELQAVSGKARYEGGALHFDVAGGTAVGLQHGRRLDRPHRAGRPAAAICDAAHADHGLRPGRHPLPGAAQARPAQGCALRLPASGRQRRDRPVAPLPAARTALTVDRARHQGRRLAVALLAAQGAGRARPHRTPRRG